MRFKFPLQKVLQHREVLEDLAERDFQEAMGELNIEIDKLEKMQNQIVDARASAYKTQVDGGTPGSRLVQVHDFIKGQDVRIDRQKKFIETKRQKVEEMREILRKAAVDRKIIDSLRDKKHQEFRVASRKLEQKDQDELTITRFKGRK